MTGDMIITLIVALVVFLIGREIVCWYFKQNEQVKLMHEILEQLKASNNPDYVPKKYDFKGLLRR
jgi:hypothetical protein